MKAAGLKTIPLPFPAGDDAVIFQTGMLDLIDEDPLMIALNAIHFHTELIGIRMHHPLDVRQGRHPVDLGFANPQQIEVGAIEHEKLHHLAILSHLLESSYQPISEIRLRYREPIEPGTGNRSGQASHSVPGTSRAKPAIRQPFGTRNRPNRESQDQQTPISQSAAATSSQTSSGVFPAVSTVTCAQLS